MVVDVVIDIAVLVPKDSLYELKNDCGLNRNHCFEIEACFI